jgi:hypothetical protein
MAVVSRLTGIVFLVESILLFLAAVDPGVARSLKAAMAASVLGPAGFAERIAGIWLGGAGLLGAALVAAGWWLARGERGAWGFSAALMVWHLPVLGWGTALGMAGLAALWATRQKREGVGIGVNPGWQMALGAIGATLWIYPVLASYGRRIGMPAYWGDAPWLAAVVTAELFFGWFHELGHWMAMQALGFEGGAIVWGSVAGSREGSGAWSWNVKRSNVGRWGTGYQTSAPGRMEGASTAWALISLAGPGASFLSGLCFLLGMLMLPGSQFETDWEWAALASAAFLGNALVNLMPVGGSDGAQVVHSLGGTARGKRILAELELAMYRLQGEQDLMEIDYQQKAELLAGKLAAAPSGGSQRGAGELLAEKGQALLECGEAEQALAALEEARTTLSELEPRAVELEAWTWIWTREACLRLDRHAQGDSAGSHALEAFERVREATRNWEAVIELAVHAAALHLERNDADKALALCEELIPFVPARDRMRPVAGELTGLAAMQKLAIEGNRPVLRRRCALVQAELAERILNCGQEELAVSMMQDAVRRIVAVGPRVAEGKLRLRLALLYLSLGRHNEAELAMQQGEGWHEAMREDEEAYARYRLVQSQVLLAAGRAREAAQAAAEMLRAGAGSGEEGTEPNRAPAGEKKFRQACGLAVLGEALRLAGDGEQAQKMARASCAELVPRNHPAAVAGLSTLALLHWKESLDTGALYFREAIRIAAESNLEPPHARARLLDRLSERLAREQRLPEAEAASAAASQLRLRGAAMLPEVT